jgi:hypothetical protein
LASKGAGPFASVHYRDQSLRLFHSEGCLDTTVCRQAGPLDMKRER